MKIGLIAWERFSYGGVSRIISSVVNELLLNNEIELKILCLKEKNFFQNVYGTIRTSRTYAIQTGEPI